MARIRKSDQLLQIEIERPIEAYFSDQSKRQGQLTAVLRLRDQWQTSDYFDMMKPKSDGKTIK